MIIHIRQPPSYLLDRELRWVKQSLDRHSDLRVLLRDNAQNLLNDSLLIDSVAIDAQRTHQAGEAKHKVVHMLAVVEGDQLPLPTQPLYGCLAGAIKADVNQLDPPTSLDIFFTAKVSIIFASTVKKMASSTMRSS